MFLITIQANGRGISCAITERIKGCIARTDDTVVQDRDRILINTKFPAEFVTAYFADGFVEPIEVESCVEF